MQHWFEDWFNSPYYHKLYFNRDEQEAAGFINTLIAKLQPPPGARMLDIACGKGRHALKLSQMGYDVTGIDLSRDSIEFATRHESENLHFYIHDMRRPSWINYFDFAFNFFTSFGYFNSLREHNDTLKSISDALKCGGFFLLDYLNVPYAEATLKSDSKENIGSTTFTITRSSGKEYFEKKILVEDPDLSSPLVFYEKVAKFSGSDLKKMLAAAGFSITDKWGDYELSDYNELNSPRLIILAKKEG